jgi:hypothetical protein
LFHKIATFCCVGNHMLRCRAEKCKLTTPEAVPASCAWKHLFMPKNNFPR